MADKPRPPMASLDAAWEEDTALSEDGPPGTRVESDVPPIDAKGERVGASPAPSPVSKPPSAPPPPPSARPRSAPPPPPPARPRSVPAELPRTRTGTQVLPRPPELAETPDTAVLEGEELDELVHRSSAPHDRLATDTVTLPQTEMDRLLEQDRSKEVPGSRVPSAPPPPPQWRTADAFGSGPPTSRRGAGAVPPSERTPASLASEASDVLGRLENRLGSAHDAEMATPHAPMPFPRAPSYPGELSPELIARAHGREEMVSAGGLPRGPVPPAPPPPRVFGRIADPDSVTTMTSPPEPSEVAFGASHPPHGYPAPSGGAGHPFQTDPIFERSVPAMPYEAPRPTPLPVYASSSPPVSPPLSTRPQAAPPRPPVTGPPLSRLAIVTIAAAAVTLAIGTVLLKRVLYRDKTDQAQPTGTGLVVSASGSAQQKKPPPLPASIDDEAKQALAKLRDGVGTCVKDNIGVLPGSSPAVPAKLESVKSTGYSSAPGEWKKPVWACTKFSMDRPQHFQIQWQQQKVRSDGVGVVWIDADADGKADRAFGFRAKLKRKGEVELGDIEPFEPSHPVTGRR